MFLSLTNPVKKMTDNYQDKNNPIKYFHKGRAIRSHNTLQIRVDEITLKKIIDIEEETGLSPRKILSYSSTPCERCANVQIRVMTDAGEVRIDRGILSKRIPASPGNKKRNLEKGRKVEDAQTGKIYSSIKEVSRIFELTYSTLVDKLNGRIPNNTNFTFYEPSIELCENHK